MKIFYIKLQIYKYVAENIKVKLLTKICYNKEIFCDSYINYSKMYFYYVYTCE